MSYRLYYRRNLPHWQPAHRWFSITCRLAGSLPRTILDRTEQQLARLERTRLRDEDRERRLQILRQTRRCLLEQALDRAGAGPTWLADDRIAAVVADAIRHHDGRLYRLAAWVVMSNHVHLLMQPLAETAGVSPPAIATIMKSLKSFTARRANILLGREGAFWQRESFDRCVRGDESIQGCRAYIEDNPVNAGLCRTPQDWSWSSACRHRQSVNADSNAGG